MIGLLPVGWQLRTQLAVTLSDSQPEPDFAVVRGTPRSFLTRHPQASDVGLVIEVANSSLLRDQQDKARIYADAGIPNYWIINLSEQRIEVFTQPSGPHYDSVRAYGPGEIVPFVLDGQVVAQLATAELLP